MYIINMFPHDVMHGIRFPRQILLRMAIILKTIHAIYVSGTGLNVISLSSDFIPI